MQQDNKIKDAGDKKSISSFEDGQPEVRTVPIMKSGFVAIAGQPNVGKSTLLNQMLGEKISVVSSKPQTTRDKILGIITGDNHQIIFVDTPGIHTPRNKLGSYMINQVREGMSDVDVVIWMIDVTRPALKKQSDMLTSYTQSGLPVLLALNKVDRVAKESILPIIADCSNLFNFHCIIPISAYTGDGVDRLKDEILTLLPEGPQYFPDDMITDQPEKQIVAEIIREKMLYCLDNELPYGTAVEILSMKQHGKLFKMLANIYCEKESHKNIIIGKNGDMLKKIGSMARVDIEKFLDSKVFLELWVKVKKDWRNNNFMMQNLGYKG